MHCPAVTFSLIQLGGLGMITFTTVIILALGRRLSLRQERLSGAPPRWRRTSPWTG